MLACYAEQKPNKRHLTKESFHLPAVTALGIVLSTATNSIKNHKACPLNQMTEK
jgi:hypothetical protein